MSEVIISHVNIGMPCQITKCETQTSTNIYLEVREPSRIRGIFICEKCLSGAPEYYSMYKEHVDGEICKVCLEWVRYTEQLDHIIQVHPDAI